MQGNDLRLAVSGDSSTERKQRGAEKRRMEEEEDGSSTWQFASLSLKTSAAAVGRQIHRPMILLQRCLIMSLTNDTRNNNPDNYH